MADHGDPPSFILDLPASIRREVQRQCHGDWRRVTKEPDGGVTVHNHPQDEQLSRVEPSRRPPLLPVLPPLPTPLWAKGPPSKQRQPQRDTSQFRRVELPAARPRQRRKRPVEPVPVTEPEPIIFPDIWPPAPPKEEDQGPRNGKRKSRGTPRTAKEMLRRLLNLGCTYRRVKGEPWANVKYHGVPLGQVPTSDDTPRDEIAAHYQAMIEAIDTLESANRLPE